MLRPISIFLRLLIFNEPVWDIFKHIGISSAAMHALHTVWCHHELSLFTKLRLHQSCILSILLYGSESWTLLKEDLSRLESFHLKCQWQILGIKWFDFVKNVDIIAATNPPSLEDTIRCRATLCLVTWLDSAIEHPLTVL